MHYTYSCRQLDRGSYLAVSERQLDRLHMCAGHRNLISQYDTLYIYVSRGAAEYAGRAQGRAGLHLTFVRLTHVPSMSLERHVVTSPVTNSLPMRHVGAQGKVFSPSTHATFASRSRSRTGRQIPAARRKLSHSLADRGVLGRADAVTTTPCIRVDGMHDVCVCV
jgi:hypothetical protein